MFVKSQRSLASQSLTSSAKALFVIFHFTEDAMEVLNDLLQYEQERLPVFSPASQK